VIAKIKCLGCGHVWNSNAKTLKARGVFCRKCKGRNLKWFSEYTDTTLDYTKEKWDNEDFLYKEASEEKSKTSIDTQANTIEKKEKDEVLTRDEVKEQQFTQKAERLITKAGKKFSLRSTDDMILSGLQMFEDVQNKRFEESGYTYRYGEDAPERIRDEMIEAFQDAYGITQQINSGLAFWILFTIYSMPTVYHEMRYKSLGIRLKSWFSKTSAKIKEKRAVKQREKEGKRRKGREELLSEVEELEDFVNEGTET